MLHETRVVGEASVYWRVLGIPIFVLESYAS